MRVSLRVATAVATAAVVLVSCSEATGPDDGADGHMSFTYGDERFDAAGLPLVVEGYLSAADYAVAIPDSVGGLIIASFQLDEGTRGDLFILQLTERRVGEHGPCHDSSVCHGRIFLGIDAANPYDPGALWTLVGGIVSIASLTADRVTGSFTELGYSGPGDAQSMLQVEEGTFELPLLTEAEGREAMRCFLSRLTGGSSC